MQKLRFQMPEARKLDDTFQVAQAQGEIRGVGWIIYVLHVLERNYEEVTRIDAQLREAEKQGTPRG